MTLLALFPLPRPSTFPPPGPLACQPLPTDELLPRQPGPRPAVLFALSPSGWHLCYEALPHTPAASLSWVHWPPFPGMLALCAPVWRAGPALSMDMNEDGWACLWRGRGVLWSRTVSAHLGPVNPVESASSGGCGETLGWLRIQEALVQPRASAAPTPDSPGRRQDMAWDGQELALQGHSPSRKHHLGDSFWHVGDWAPAPSGSF